MSVTKRGDGWRVRWRENGQNRSRTFDRKTDATRFDEDVRRAKQIGPRRMRELTAETMTLAGYLADGFEAHAATMAPRTREYYAWALDRHLAELLAEPLDELTPKRLMTHQAHLIDNGRTPNTVRSAMTALSGVLHAATMDDLLLANPVRGLRRPPAEPKEDVAPLTPDELETIIAGLDGRSRALVVLMGHLGLRPLEARKALWTDFEGPTLTVSRVRTKSTAQRTRVLTVPATTARELRAWQLESGGRGNEPIVAVTRDMLRSWGTRNLKPAALEATGRDDVTPYTLRHTHASTLHYCGWTVPDAAARLGHSPVVHMGTYAHPIALIGNRRWRDLDELILEARLIGNIAGRADAR